MMMSNSPLKISRISNGFIGLGCMLVFSNVNAGNLSSGVWSPAHCGDKPTVPVVYDKDAEAYNNSIKAINDWQLQARSFYECLISEANADNKLIADTANREQADYRQSFDAISAQVNAAKKKLE